MKSRRFTALKKRFKNLANVRNLLIVLCILFIGSSAGAFYFYQQAKSLEPTQTSTKDPSIVAQEESEVLIAKISKLIMLPEGETPTVATVTDPQKLKDQPFFANAKRGDKVLLYVDAKKAYLYDPVANILIDVGPLNLTPTASTSSSLSTTATSSGK